MLPPLNSRRWRHIVGTGGITAKLPITRWNRDEGYVRSREWGVSLGVRLTLTVVVDRAKGQWNSNSGSRRTHNSSAMSGSTRMSAWVALITTDFDEPVA